MNGVKTTEESINVKQIVGKYVKHWRWYSVSFFVCLTLAATLLWFLPPVYKIKSTVLIKDKNNFVSSTKNFDESLDLFRSKRNLENEMGILRSYQFIHKVVKQLPFQTTYFEKQLLKTRELYQNAPFEVQVDTSHVQLTNVRFSVVFVSDKAFELRVNANTLYPKRLNEEHGHSLLADYHYVHLHNTNEPIATPYFSFRIVPNAQEENLLKMGRTYAFVLHTTHELATAYREKLKVEQESIESSIISTQIKEEVARKGIDFLNKLSETYVNSGLEEKNELADRTIQYINTQLTGISDSLVQSNKSLQAFNTNSHVVNIDLQTKHNYEKLLQLEKERAALLVKTKYYNYLYEYVTSNSEKGKLVAPSTIGIDDPLLNNLLSELVKLNSEKASLSFSAHADNPNLQMLELKIQNTKSTLKENVKSILEASQLALKDNAATMAPIHSTLNSLPVAERELMNIRRVYDHYEQIYNYLMQKRAEAEIAKASNTPHHLILDKAHTISETPVFPNKKVVIGLALILALALPTVMLTLYFAAKPSIQYVDDLRKITATPIIATVYNDKNVQKQPANSQIFNEECFRKLKAFLDQTTATHTSAKLIGISSAASKEGKTYVASRLAMTYARSGHSTVLLDFNFRKPALAAIFHLQATSTLNDVLLHDTPLDNATYATSLPLLHVVPCKEYYATVDLLQPTKLSTLFEQLKAKYAVILIDSPPSILFSDYLELLPFTDTNVFIARKGLSTSRMAADLENLIQTYAPKSSYLVFNDESSNLMKKAIESYAL